MNSDAWNKIAQTHDIFKKMIAPLKEHLGINFGYMIVFNDGSYYQIIEDLECLKKWVINVETSHIFCARNVTTYFDQPYNFTIWPEEPTCKAMEIYKEYGMWNGITVSNVNKDYTELYWFTKQNAENGWHKWFVRNKLLLLKAINYFNDFTKQLFIKLNNKPKELPKLQLGFNQKLLKSSYIDDRNYAIDKLMESLDYGMIKNGMRGKVNLSPREMEVLIYINRGYPIKTIAEKLSIAIRTVKTHVEHIKVKNNLHSKLDLIKFYENHFLYNIINPSE